MGSVIETVQDVVGVGPAIVNAAASAVKDHVAPLPFAAPKSIFNVPITGARRVAAQSWPIERLRKVSCVADVTLNDAVLAMCAGALRRYLIELDELPDKPLIAMVPVSLRKGEEGEASGNAVGAVLCDLATELVDPAARLQRVHDSMSSAKSLMSGLTPLQITALSALNVAGLGLPLIPGSSD
ncbi:wax ester/triacylglycerol synthase domain-containing protein [Rhodococcus sp. 3Y1]